MRPRPRTLSIPLEYQPLAAPPRQRPISKAEAARRSKLLFLDIETSPNIGAVFGVWEQNLAIPNLLEASRTVCVGLRWYGEDGATVLSEWKHGRKEMLRQTHAALSSADAWVHYNGTKFDIPILNAEFAREGLPPPPDVPQVDLLRTVKGRFKLPHNKLEFVLREFRLGAKVEHEGFKLWLKVLAGDKEAQNKMAEYCAGDVEQLEDVYHFLLPWIKHHPSLNLGDEGACIRCGGSKLREDGVHRTKTCEYTRFQCVDCKTWQRARRRNVEVVADLM